MFYIRNRFGRIVALNTQEEFDKWKNTPGFTVPTNKEVLEWQQMRSEEHQLREAKKRQEANKGDSDIFFATVSGGNDGYGMSSQNIYRELTRLGVKVKFQNEGQTIGLVYHAPYSIALVDTPIRVLFTMFESTKLPADWKPYLDSADRVIVPSEWCAKVFEESTGIKPDVVPLGYDDRFFKYHQRDNKRAQGRPFVFLHYNAYNLRKGFTEVVKAFTEEFERDEPVKMIFKTNLQRPPFPFVKEKYPNIEVISEQMPPHALAELCKQSDCFVFPSRGEGFGITPLEAMATGLPVIVPNAHGISEYFNDRYMYEVKVAGYCPGIYYRYKGQDVGQMVVCDVKHLRQQMRYIYEHQEEALEKGRFASKYAKQYTYTQTAQRLKEIFDDILSKPLPVRKDSDILSLERVA